jgi:hypothetical protein
VTILTSPLGRVTHAPIDGSMSFGSPKRNLPVYNRGLLRNSGGFLNVTKISLNRTQIWLKESRIIPSKSEESKPYILRQKTTTIGLIEVNLQSEESELTFCVTCSTDTGISTGASSPSNVHGFYPPQTQGNFMLLKRLIGSQTEPLKIQQVI